MGIIKHKILRGLIPDNMKVKISKKFIKVTVISKELTIDEKLSKYENIKLIGCIIVLLKETGEFEEFRINKNIIKMYIEYMNIMFN